MVGDMSRPRKRLLTFNDPQPLRIDRRLAMEIGFLESVVLLQLEFLISISHNEREGQFWTYHTLKQLQERHFPWLSQATICRTIQSLEEKGLIVRGHFNRSGFDRTQWFALNYEGIAQLKSIRIGEDAPILQSATSVFQDAKPVLHDETPVLQTEVTIPETTTERTTEISNNNAAVPASGDTQTTAGVQDVVVALVRSLTDAGVTKKRAERLVARHTPEQIRNQLAFLQYRKADDPAAVLVRAIEEDWAAPAEYQKAQAEREKKERLRSRRRQKAEEQAAEAAAEEAARAAQDNWWNALEPGEREKLIAQAEAALRANNAFLFVNGEPKRNGVMYQTMLDAERRRLISELIGEPK